MKTKIIFFIVFLMSHTSLAQRAQDRFNDDYCYGRNCLPESEPAEVQEDNNSRTARQPAAAQPAPAPAPPPARTPRDCSATSYENCLDEDIYGPPGSSGAP